MAFSVSPASRAIARLGGNPWAAPQPRVKPLTADEKPMTCDCPNLPSAAELEGMPCGDGDRGEKTDVQRWTLSANGKDCTAAYTCKGGDVCSCRGPDGGAMSSAYLNSSSIAGKCKAETGLATPSSDCYDLECAYNPAIGACTCYVQCAETDKHGNCKASKGTVTYGAPICPEDARTDQFGTQTADSCKNDDWWARWTHGAGSFLDDLKKQAEEHQDDLDRLQKAMDEIQKRRDEAGFPLGEGTDESPDFRDADDLCTKEHCLAMASLGPDSWSGFCSECTTTASGYRGCQQHGFESETDKRGFCLARFP